MKKIFVSILLLFFSLNAQELIILESRHSVATTMNRLASLVQSKGLTLFGVIDHRKAAQKAGMDMNDEQLLIFGNPKVGTSIMLKDPRAGIDLPLKILVYKDKAGRVWILYKDPLILAKEYRLGDFAALPKLHKALQQLTRKAAN